MCATLIPPTAFSTLGPQDWTKFGNVMWASGFWGLMTGRTLLHLDIVFHMIWMHTHLLSTSSYNSLFLTLKITQSTGSDLKNPGQQKVIFTSPVHPLLRWRWRPMCFLLISLASLSQVRRTWLLHHTSWSGSQSNRILKGASPPPRFVQ